MARFTGKTVLVTGAASGIGLAAARRFSAEGANVVSVNRDQAKTERAVADLPAERTLAIGADVAEPGSAERLVRAAVERFGALDVLVNNAGVVVVGDVTATGDEDWQRVMDVNVGGYFRMARAALPELKKTRGAIVQTSSVSGIGGDWGMAAYNASKGAVTNLTRAMALDHGKDGVRVNAVAPTFTDTGMTADFQDEATVAKFIERIPMRRIGRAEDVAAAIAFLAGEDAGFVTGVILPVDGGLSASNGQPAM